MDQHYLTPLFSPQSIVVFAGDADRPEAVLRVERLDRMRETVFVGEFEVK